MLFIVSSGRSNGITINVNRAHVDKSGQVTPYQEVKFHLSPYYTMCFLYFALANKTNAN